MLRTPPQPFGTPATRLHGGRVVLALAVLVALGMSAWIWLTRHDSASKPVNVETASQPGWTAAQQHYERPEPPKEVQAPKPVDMTAAELARLKAMMLQMQAAIDELQKRKTGGTTIVQPPQPKPQPPAKAPGSLLFVEHQIKDTPALPKANEFTLAAGSKIPCLTEASINSEIPGVFTAKVSTNVYDSKTGKHLLVAQGSTILGAAHGDVLLFGNERVPTTTLTLNFSDGRSVELGTAPITDQEGVIGLTGIVDNHWWRLVGAVFIGGALRGGTQALQTAIAQQAGVGQIAAGYSSVANQALSPRIGRALDTRPTIRILGGQMCNVIVTKPLSLAAMWE